MSTYSKNDFMRTKRWKGYSAESNNAKRDWVRSYLLIADRTSRHSPRF
jgi:hypothetical protein